MSVTPTITGADLDALCANTIRTWRWVREPAPGERHTSPLAGTPAEL
jgi:hypothetical protein